MAPAGALGFGPLPSAGKSSSDWIWKAGVFLGAGLGACLTATGTVIRAAGFRVGLAATGAARRVALTCLTAGFAAFLAWIAEEREELPLDVDTLAWTFFAGRAVRLLLAGLAAARLRTVRDVLTRVGIVLPF